MVGFDHLHDGAELTQLRVVNVHQVEQLREFVNLQVLEFPRHVFAQPPARVVQLSANRGAAPVGARRDGDESPELLLDGMR